MIAEECLQLFGVLRQAVLALEVFVEQWQREITQVDDGDFSTGGACGVCGGADELFVKRSGAGAAGKGEDFGCAHAVCLHAPATMSWAHLFLRGH